MPLLQRRLGELIGGVGGLVRIGALVYKNSELQLNLLSPRRAAVDAVVQARLHGPDALLDRFRRLRRR